MRFLSHRLNHKRSALRPERRTATTARGQPVRLRCCGAGAWPTDAHLSPVASSKQKCTVLPVVPLDPGIFLWRCCWQSACMPACLWGPRIPRQPRPQASPLSHRYYLLQNRMRKSRKAQGGPAAPSRFSPDTLSRTTTLPAGAHLPSLPSIGLGSVATGQPGRDQSASSAQRPGLTGNLVSPAANSGTGRSLALRNPHGRKWRRTKEPLDETERGEQKSWLKTQHSKNGRSWHLVPSLHGK